MDEDLIKKIGFYSTYEELKHISMDEDLIKKIGFYSTYEELKLSFY